MRLGWGSGIGIGVLGVVLVAVWAARHPLERLVRGKTGSVASNLIGGGAIGRSGGGSAIKPVHTIAAVITADYQRARWDPIHFPPKINKATNADCLVCHKEILDHKVRKRSPAGLEASKVRAWYQTLDTYRGDQLTFHARHLTSLFARQVMDLKCTFCHQGSDPREEVPGSSATAMPTGNGAFTLRKMVNPSKTCLRCHGAFPYKQMVGLEGPWSKARADMEDPSDPDTRNGCLTCHGKMYRTVRHQVTYLKANAIEQLARKGSSDVCYGCHGGRAWYRISYPYPRHAWPGMADVVETTPDWAKGRPTESDPRYRIEASKAK